MSKSSSTFLSFYQFDKHHLIIIIIISRYRGPAHQGCNLNYQDTKTVPVVFHNLSVYDSHLFIKEIATCYEGRVTLIPQRKERYISFTKYVEESDINLRFFDSLRFMMSSLDKLSSYLDHLNIVEEVCKADYTAEQLHLLKKKGVFPYEYVDSTRSWRTLISQPRRHFSAV